MRRTTLHTLIALALAVLFVAPVAAVEPGGAAQETISGTLGAYWLEDPKGGHGHEEYELRTSTGVVPLEFADGGPEGLGGAKVQVTGRRVGRSLKVAGSTPGRGLKVRGQASAELGAWSAIDGSGTTSGTTSAGGGTAYSTTATVSKSFAVVLVNFTNLATQPWTKATVQNALTGSSDEHEGVLRGGVQGADERVRHGLRLVHHRGHDHRL